MELYTFIRFHARDGEEANVAAAIRDVIPPSRAEPGCIAIDGFASTRDPRLFYIHSRWVDEAAFDLHGTLAAYRQLHRARDAADRSSVRSRRGRG